MEGLFCLCRFWGLCFIDWAFYDGQDVLMIWAYVMPRKRLSMALLLCAMLFACMPSFASGDLIHDVQNIPVHLSISGLAEPALTNVMHAVKNQLNKVKVSDMSDAYVLKVRLMGKIKKALRVYGYFHPLVRLHFNSYIKDSIDLQVRVAPGDPVKLTSYHFRVLGPGSEDLRLRDALGHYVFKLKKDDVFNSAFYEEDKQSMHDIAIRHGYLRARVEQSHVTVHVKQDEADIDLILDTGVQYHFGAIHIKTAFDEGFVQRYLDFKSGDVFSERQLSLLQSNLLMTPYFKRVEVRPDFRDKKAGTIPIYIATEQRKKVHYNMGLGYNTDFGVQLMGNLVLRYLNSVGDNIALSTLWSSKTSFLNFSFNLPGRQPVSEAGKVSFFVAHEDLNTIEGDKLSLSYEGSKRFSDWYRILGAHFLLEKSTQYKNTTEAKGDPDDLLNWYRAFYPIATFWHTWSFPSPAHVQKINIYANALGGLNRIFSSASFLQFDFKGTIGWRLTAKADLLLRGEYGLTVTSDFDVFAPSLQFIAGGIGTIRGYDYKSIGPGKYLRTISTELQHQIYRQWYGVGFVDMGNVGDSNRSSLLKAFGFGVVYKSPVGDLEVSLAHPCKMSEGSWHIQLGIVP
jgi:translocation and assembly module TamA